MVKRCTKPYPNDLRPINWKDISQQINQMPLNAGSHDSFYAIEKFNALVEKLRVL